MLNARDWYSRTSWDISYASDWSRWPSRPIRSLRYIATCARISKTYWRSLWSEYRVTMHQRWKFNIDTRPGIFLDDTFWYFWSFWSFPDNSGHHNISHLTNNAGPASQRCLIWWPPPSEYTSPLQKVRSVGVTQSRDGHLDLNITTILLRRGRVVLDSFGDIGESGKRRHQMKSNYTPKMRCFHTICNKAI